jgi:hypothetical protein
MALLSMRQAADTAGVSRQTLYRYVKDGTISASVGPDGQKQVDTAELLRVWPELRTPVSPVAPETVTGDSLRQPETASVTDAETGRLQAELAAAQVLLDVTRTELAATRERENKLLDIVQNQTRLLEYRPPAAPPAPASPARTASPWPWIALVGIVAVVAVVVAVTWAAPSRTPPATPAATPAAPPPPAPQAPANPDAKLGEGPARAPSQEPGSTLGTPSPNASEPR